jgi:hypothetical protein
MQARWALLHYSVLLLSVLVWFATAFIFTSAIFIDYDWHYVSIYLFAEQAVYIDIEDGTTQY